MHRFYFPACPVDGPIEPPVPFNHLGLAGAIPQKCSRCEHSFEGSCTRFADKVQRYMHLDHGPCGIDGPTDPVTYEDRYITSKVEVPRKCAACRFLLVHSVYGFTCTSDSETWGDHRRGLDWGHWSPDRIYFDLPPPKITTRLLSDAAHDADLTAFVKEYRRVNPGLSLAEAKSDYETLRQLIEAGSQDPS